MTRRRFRLRPEFDTLVNVEWNESMPLNVPNQITLARLVLACVFFAILSFAPASHLESARSWLTAAFWVFLVAVVTDAVDGHIARRLKQVSTFGRIVDPVVDKVLVCGAFAFLAGARFHAPDGSSLSGVAPWIVVLIVGRELLISAFRAQSEAAGRDFSAVWSGKIKMIIQSVTVCVIIGRLAFFPANGVWAQIANGLVWLTVVVTIWSLYTYVRRAWPMEVVVAAPPPENPSKHETESTQRSAPLAARSGADSNRADSPNASHNGAKIRERAVRGATA